MLEILIITIIVGIWLVTVMLITQKVKISVNETKQNVIANQLAIEWIEKIYQIRNTNLLRHQDYLGPCRLAQDPFVTSCDGSSTTRLTELNYIIITGWSLSWTSEILDISDWISTWEQIFNLCLEWWERISCPWSWNQTKYGKFYRSIEWKGLYLKNTNTTGGQKIYCNSWASENCYNDDAKEYRFCSKVQYISTKTWSVELCWVLTNFFD